DFFATKHTTCGKAGVNQFGERGCVGEDRREVLAFGVGHFEQVLRRAIDYRHSSIRIEGDQTGGHARHDPIAEGFSRIGALARLIRESLKLLLLLLKPRDDRLKSFEDERSFVLGFARVRYRCALSFTHKLAIRTQQSAQQPGDADHAHKQRDHECSQEKRPVNECSFRSNRKNRDDQHGAEQKDSRKKDEQILKAAGVHSDSRNGDAYQMIMREPKSSETIEPMPRKIPNGNSICRLRPPRRYMTMMPAIDPESAPSRIVRIVRRHPRNAPTINIIFTSPKPIASTPRSFSHMKPISHSEPPPASAPIAAPMSETSQTGSDGNADMSCGRSSKCAGPAREGTATRVISAK